MEYLSTVTMKYSNSYQFPLYRRKALRIWKQTNGSDATYGNLIKVFERAGYHGYADTVKNICGKLKL